MVERARAGPSVSGKRLPEPIDGPTARGAQPGLGEPMPGAPAPRIGALLRIMHEAMLLEPMPERFLELLRQIDGKAGGATDRPDPAAPPNSGHRA
jgi:hypothetical protein